MRDRCRVGPLILLAIVVAAACLANALCHAGVCDGNVSLTSCAPIGAPRSGKEVESTFASRLTRSGVADNVFASLATAS